MESNCPSLRVTLELKLRFMSSSDASIDGHRRRAVTKLQSSVRGYQARTFIELRRRYHGAATRGGAVSVLLYSKCASAVQAIARGYIVRSLMHRYGARKDDGCAEQPKVERSDSMFLSSRDGSGSYGTVMIDTAGPVRERLGRR